MPSKLQEPAGLQQDPALIPPAPLQGYVKETVLGPGGEGGEAPQDPINGDGTIQVQPQPSPSQGSISGSAKENVGRLSCYEFHYIDLVCGTHRSPSFFGGYWYGGNIGQFDCPDSGNSSIPGSLGPGIPGNSSCASTYAGPNGVKCAPTCSEGAGSDIPAGPVTEQPPPPTGGGGDGGATGGTNNSPGGSATPNDNPSSGSGTSAGSGAGGSISGGIFVGGGGGSGGPGIMDYPPNNGNGTRQFTIEVSDGQAASATLKEGEFVRVIRNSDGTIIVGKVVKQGSKTFFVEIQRIQPASQLGEGQLQLNQQTKVLQGQITQLQGQVTQLVAQISKISEKPLGDGVLQKERFYPTPPTTLITKITKVDPEEPEPPRNDPRPRKKKKNRSEDDSKSKPSPPSPSSGQSGTTIQVVIVQDDSSQSFVRVT